MNLLQDLNERQRQAVTYDNGPLLIIAGAGSGKTRVLTYKIAYLLEQGVLPMRIMALTFTNKASREMCDRIQRLVGNNSARRLWAGTFHSVFSRLLRIEASALGISPDFSIYDQSDSRQLIKTIVKEMGLDDKVYKPAVIGNRISAAKNKIILPETYRNTPQIYQRDQRDNIPRTGEIYQRYMERCRMSNALDFDDLLLYTYLLLQRNETVRQHYQQRFDYILVDEYQDTNVVQFRIIRLLSPEGKGLSVVGDDAQSIYGFRGAEIDNILNFTQTYPATVTVKLEQNYRSTQNIVGLANSIISHNRRRIPKEVFSKEASGEKVKIISAYSDKEEAYRVVREIGRLNRAEHLSNEDIAILYRTNAQSRAFEEVLQERGIPYRIYGGLSFYQRKEIKDLLAYMRLVNNLRDDEACVRIINYPARGIGQTTVQKLRQAARDNNTTLYAVAAAPQRFSVAINAGTAAKLQRFVAFIQQYVDQRHTLSTYEIASSLFQLTGMEADIRSEDREEALAKTQNIREFLNSIRAFEQERLEETGEETVTLAQFLSHVSLLSDMDQKETGEARISLMTVHSAKGLEYDAVFVTGMEDELFPAPQSRYSEREMEEERRLFYVAVTRAKRFCYISHARTRFRYGSVDNCMPSPFLDEIDKAYVADTDDNPAPKQHRTAERTNKPLFSDFTPSRPAPKLKPLRSIPLDNEPTSLPPGLKTGCEITHERFGKGRVQSIEGQGASTVIVVHFENVGTKKLLLKFAKFTIL